MLHTPNRPARQHQAAQHDDDGVPQPPSRFEVLISSNGSAALNGELLPVAEGGEVHVAVLDALQQAAQGRGGSIDATILDLRENGYATHIRVAPDGSSQMLVNGAETATPADPVRSEPADAGLAEPAAPVQAEPVDAVRTAPADPVRTADPDATTQLPVVPAAAGPGPRRAGAP